MKRAYDIVKSIQDLRYLDFGEKDMPTGLRGSARKAREGTGANAVYYKLPPHDRRTGGSGYECLNELVACRLANLLGIEHVGYRLVRARVAIAGEERETWLLRSKSFRKDGERKMPFALFYRLEREQGETPFELACRMGWRSAVEQMLAFDYVIGNDRRDASNVEVLCTASGRLRLAPLFASGHSLLSTCVSYGATGRLLDPLRDILAENCFGGTSLEENLRLIGDASECTSGLRPLNASSREPLLRGLSDVLPAADLEAIWAIVWTRWERYASLCRL